MPGKRPAPLSDDVFNAGQAKVVGGALVGGAALKVKNTFIDMPSGFTPSNMTSITSKQLMQTAPPDMTQTSGFLQRAIAGNTMSGTPADRNALATPSSSSLGAFQRANFIQTPQSPSMRMATPSTGFIQTPQTASPTAYSRMFPGGYFANGPLMGAMAQASAASGPTLSLPAGTGIRIPAAPTWQPTLPSATTSAPSWSAAELRPGIPAAPMWQPTIIGTAPSAPLVAAPLYSSGFLAGPSVTDFIEDDEAEEDSDGEVPPEQRNMEDAPKPPPGALHPSEGSEAHESGTCKRCCFYPRGRCTNGYNCEFCHYEHEKRKRKNKKKKKKDNAAAVVTAATVLSIGGQQVNVGVQPQLVQNMTSLAPATSSIYSSAPGACFYEAGDPRSYGLSRPMAPLLQPLATTQAVYSTAPAEPMYQAMPPPMPILPPQPTLAPAPQMAAPPGFVSFQAADGRQVFVQQTAPQPLGMPPPLATQPAPLFGADVVTPMPPPMQSPKMARVIGGPAFPPPMASPKLLAQGNMLPFQQNATWVDAPPQVWG